jgi:hypothetical protein
LRTKRTEELSHILNDESRYFQRSEMPAARHRRAALDPQEALSQLARRQGQVLGEDGNARGLLFLSI